MKKLLQIVRSLGLLLFGMAAGLFLGASLIRQYEWSLPSLFLLVYGLYISALVMIHARTRKERTERTAEAVRKFRLREKRFGLRAVTLLRTLGIGLLVLGLAIIFIAGVSSYTAHAIFPIAVCVMIVGFLIAAPFCYPASRAFRLQEEKDHNKAVDVPVE